MTASRHVPALLTLCLLCAAPAAVAGTRAPLQGPAGDGGECTEADAVAPEVPEAAPAAKPAATAAPKPAAAPTRVHPIVPVRSGGNSDTGNVHAPRWHSFLPGMFR